MTNLLKNTVQVGDTELVNVSMKDFLSLEPIYTQRLSERRVGKMRPVFDSAYVNKKASTLSVVALGVAMNEIKDPDSGAVLPKGSITIVDACTRKHYWEEYPETQKHHSNGLTAIVHRLKSHKDVDAAYYPYNNKKSAETKADVIQGLNRKFNFTPKQTTFASGSFGSALSLASMNSLDKNEGASDVFEQYFENFDALKALDAVPKGSDFGITKPKIGNIKSQVIIGACLLALRNHPGNVLLLEFISRLATVTDDELKDIVYSSKEASAAEMVALEYSGYSRGRNGLSPNQIDQGWLKGIAGSLKFADVRGQMDFILFYISKSINSPSETINICKVQHGATGVLPIWDKAWETWY